MRHPTFRRAALAVLAFVAIGIAFADDAKGSFGFAAKVDSDGFFDPTLKSVFVQSVQPGLPAARAGIVVGDSIIEVDGTKVAGAKASAMADRMKKKPGQQAVLKLLRVNGETYVVTLTAEAKN